jgi:hypothetical protein
MRARPRIGTAQVKWLSTRQKRRRAKSTPLQVVALRLSDFARLFRSRYGIALPDDDSGRDDIEPVMHHLAALSQPARRARHWLEVWAPWLTIGEQRDLIARAIAAAKPWTADQLAWRYRVTKEERTMLGLTTIGAIYHGKRARAKRRKERDRQRKAAARRAAGAMTRGQYEASALTRAKPWEAEGISRRTWYRRRARGTDTTPATA